MKFKSLQWYIGNSRVFNKELNRKQIWGGEKHAYHWSQFGVTCFGSQQLHGRSSSSSVSVLARLALKEVDPSADGTQTDPRTPSDTDSRWGRGRFFTPEMQSAELGGGWVRLRLSVDMEAWLLIETPSPPPVWITEHSSKSLPTRLGDPQVCPGVVLV